MPLYEETKPNQTNKCTFIDKQKFKNWNIYFNTIFLY